MDFGVWTDLGIVVVVVFSKKRRIGDLQVLELSDGLMVTDFGMERNGETIHFSLFLSLSNSPFLSHLSFSFIFLFYLMLKINFKCVFPPSASMSQSECK